MTAHIYASSFFINQSKHVKIRIKKWMELILKPENGPIWKENKLTFLKLLQLMCDC